MHWFSQTILSWLLMKGLMFGTALITLLFANTAAYILVSGIMWSISAILCYLILKEQDKFEDKYIFIGILIGILLI